MRVMGIGGRVDMGVGGGSFANSCHPAQGGAGGKGGGGGVAFGDSGGGSVGGGGGGRGGDAASAGQLKADGEASPPHHDGLAYFQTPSRGISRMTKLSWKY